VREVLFGNTGLAIRIGELAGEKGREEGPDERIRKANDTSKAVVGDIVEANFLGSPRGKLEYVINIT
jgi:hypothetical protein